MWYKVKELRASGLNKSQISREVGIDRQTVRRYLTMDEVEFLQWIQNRKHIPLKLKQYYSYVEQELQKKPYLSAAQIEDRLKENFPNLPGVHPKTVYNFVQTIRKKAGIHKPKVSTSRDTQKLPDGPYGKEAQVDFGQAKIKDKEGKSTRVWFFAMVLCRSRQKYIYIQDVPFTSDTAIYAHQMAFMYFEGVPQAIIYDQDRVFMKDENLGDLILTDKFSRYSLDENFKAVFCRKGDPQSKGKVENVVKYVKYNFLLGRDYQGIEKLNREALAWLARTANGKKHSTTRKIPQQEWAKERHYLLPIKIKVHPLLANFDLTHKLLKDNTIIYKGNFYSVPVGTYRGPESRVILSISENKIRIYNESNTLIAEHTLCLLKGQYIRNNSHAKDNSKLVAERQQRALQIIGGTEKAQVFLEIIQKSKPRYYLDNLKKLIQGLREMDPEVIDKALDFCLDNNLFNGNNLCQAALYFQKQSDTGALNVKLKAVYPIKASINPQTSKIDTYQELFNNTTNNNLSDR